MDGAKRILHVVEIAVFATDEQIGPPVAIEIDGCGACRMSCQFAVAELTGVAEDHAAAGLFGGVAEEIDIGGVHQQVALAVSVEVDDGDLPPPAAAGFSAVQSQRCAGIGFASALAIEVPAQEDPFSGQQDQCIVLSPALKPR